MIRVLLFFALMGAQMFAADYYRLIHRSSGDALNNESKALKVSAFQPG